MRKLTNDELGRITQADFRQKEKTPLVIVLDNVRSMNNIGSIFRTADAFLIEAIYLCGISACPPHREIEKTALGATSTVTWKHFKNASEAIQELKQRNYIIVAVEQTDSNIPLNKFFPSQEKKYALIFGHEMNGVSEEAIQLSDFSIEVPQYGTKHSLNIAVCAGVVVWDFYSKMLGGNNDIK
ncbi:MAG: RNA methyltransferase [Bacteroidia bacterium]|nr:RNA methyltransferase [Bacteroidia bacterium]